jgi:hypothetical protein
MDRFPVWHFTVLSYRVVFANIDLLLGTIGLWLSLDLIFFVAGQSEWLSDKGLFWLLFVTLQMFVAPTAVACTWHRYVLLGHEPSVSASMRVSRSELTYVGRWLLLSAICGLVILAITVPYLFALDLPRMSRRIGELHQTDSPFPFIEIMVPLLIVATLVGGVGFRTVLAFPAAAIGDYATTIGVSWTRTRGQTWRLALGGFACCLPLVLVGEFVAFAIDLALPTDMPERWVPWVSLLDEAIIQGAVLIQTAVFATFISQLYQADIYPIRAQGT